MWILWKGSIQSGPEEFTQEGSLEEQGVPNYGKGNRRWGIELLVAESWIIAHMKKRGTEDIV